MKWVHAVNYHGCEVTLHNCNKTGVKNHHHTHRILCVWSCFFVSCNNHATQLHSHNQAYTLPLIGFSVPCNNWREKAGCGMLSQPQYYKGCKWYSGRSTVGFVLTSSLTYWGWPPPNESNYPVKEEHTGGVKAERLESEFPTNITRGNSGTSVHGSRKHAGSTSLEMMSGKWICLNFILLASNRFVTCKLTIFNTILGVFQYWPASETVYLES